MKIIFEIIIGILLAIIGIMLIRFSNSQGVIEIDESDPDKSNYLLVLTIPVEKLEKYKRLIFKVRDVTEIVKNKRKDAE